MSFDVSYDASGVLLALTRERPGLLNRILGRRALRDLEHLSPTDRPIAFALADLRALCGEESDRLKITESTVHLSHELVSQIDSRSADVLNLPPPVDLVLETDAEGMLGKPSFRITYTWSHHGRKEIASRVGAILETSRGPRRLPDWLLEALEVADAFKSGEHEASHWEALARFRQALDPGVTPSTDTRAARVSMTEFLQGLRVRITNRFSISPIEADGLMDFNVVPFSGRHLAEADLKDDDVSETDGELDGGDLAVFQDQFRNRGLLPAYRLGDRGYLVVDRSSAPVLGVLADMQSAPPLERDSFVRSPRRAITDAVEASLRDNGRLDGLSPADEEETIEIAAQPMLIETREYSERVIGLSVYRATQSGTGLEESTTWLPETFTDGIVHALDEMGKEDLRDVRDRLDAAITSGTPTIEIAGQAMLATADARHTIDVRLEAARRREAEGMAEIDVPDHLENESADDGSGPLVLDTVTNFDGDQWRPKRGRRATTQPSTVPTGIETPLKPHQVDGLTWQQAAWSVGLPGVLNADEQGLGKTLQTIAFLRWLKQHTSMPGVESGGPLLVVAPASLLENWEAEVRTHLDSHGLGHLIRLYGSGISTFKTGGVHGVETRTGAEHLDFSQLRVAIEEDKGHRFWILTTYQTLTNYHHSLATIPFAAVVFDEIQALKNPGTLYAVAARAVNADFRIGLTGTPIENSVVDLWAIMNQLCPGSLPTLSDFRQRYSSPDETNMSELHARVFKPSGDLPALALRRLKEDVARELEPKARLLHPRVMPPEQAVTYERARLKLSSGAKGAALKMLHHIRSVSVHPALDDGGASDEFIALSGRLDATFDILRNVQARGEKALVFIEHRRMQERFLELARQQFGLERIDLINGDTPIPKRKMIVDRFQRHLRDDEGFDLLVLGPKSAGTGLTLTAATHVIHLSRWWNPAVEEQCNDRVHRIGQTRPVTVHVPMAIHPGYLSESFDCLLHSLMTRKRKLASAALWPMGDTSGDTGALQGALNSAKVSDAAALDPVMRAMDGMFHRDGRPTPALNEDGSLSID